MFEFPLGSVSFKVTGNFTPVEYKSNFSKNAFIFVACSSPISLFFKDSCKSSLDLNKIDSIVVISDLLFGGNVNSSSSISKVQCSDLITSRLRSSLLKHLKRMLIP